MILTKLDQYTTCVLNKHKVQPCLHYKELRVLVCYRCYNWHLNFGYQLRLPSWNIVNNKYGQIKFDYFLKFKSVPIPPGPYTNYWIPKMNLLYYINTKKKKKCALDNKVSRAWWNKTRKLVSTSIYYNNLTYHKCQEFYINKTKHTNI